jgi:hypothetical protein
MGLTPGASENELSPLGGRRIEGLGCAFDPLVDYARGCVARQGFYHAIRCIDEARHRETASTKTVRLPPRFRSWGSSAERDEGPFGGVRPT